MKIARKYSEFLLYQLMESVMVTTTEFKDILNIIPDTDKIADVLWEIIKRGKDIKTNYNMIGVDPDKNDEISFIPDSQYQRFITKGDDISTKTKSKVAIGRLVRQILKDNGHEGFTDSDIEKFVNSFKAAWNKKHGITNRETKIVKGKDIQKWYSSDNYKSDKGTLGSSCMRYPNVNNFMRLYSENPDKVSMVIVTEEGQLVARAILWELSWCEKNDIKYFLDRIYTEGDSDQEYVYNWVIDNVVKGNKSIVASYFKREFNEMIIKLDKVIFDTYPYADTMNYLYEKIENGKLTGSGYVSNEHHEKNDDIVKNFVISEIRDHRNGQPTVFSHRYSSKLDIYISIFDAVETIDGQWVPKSMCKWCEYKDIWIFEDDAVYSESMGDWIAKSDAISHEKYGLILRGSLLNIAVKYIGTYTDPTDIYSALDAGEVLFEFDEVLRKSIEKNEFFVPEYRPGRQRYYSNEFRVLDHWGEPQIRLTCYKLNEVVDSFSSVESKLGEFSYLIRQSIISNDVGFMFKEDAELFGIKVKSDEVYSSFVDIRSTYARSMNYKQLVDFIGESNAPKEVKDKVIYIKHKIHENNLNSNPSYRRSYGMFIKFGDSPEKVFIDVSNRILNKMIKEKRNIVVQFLKNKFGSNDVVLSDENITVLLDMLRPFASLFLLYGDTGDSMDKLEKWVRDDPELFGLDGFIQHRDRLPYRSVLELLRRSFRDDINDIHRSYIQDILNVVAVEYVTSADQVWSYVRKSSDSKIGISDFI